MLLSCSHDATENAVHQSGKDSTGNEFVTQVWADNVGISTTSWSASAQHMRN